MDSQKRSHKSLGVSNRYRMITHYLSCLDLEKGFYVKYRVQKRRVALSPKIAKKVYGKLRLQTLNSKMKVKVTVFILTFFPYHNAIRLTSLKRV